MVMRLDDGESAELISPLSRETLAYIGSTGDDDDSPVYTSTVFISNGDNLTAAIGKLDAQLASGIFNVDVKIYNGHDLLMYSDAGTTLKYSIDGATGISTAYGNTRLYSGADLLVYSDAGTTLKATIDGATGYIGSGVAPSYRLHLFGDSYDSKIFVHLRNGVTTAAYGELIFFRDRSLGGAGVINDDIGLITYKSNDSAGSTIDYAQIFTEITSPTAGAATGQISLRVAVASLLVTKLGIYSDSLYIQQGDKLIFDGTPTGDTYLISPSSNVLDAYVGGTNYFKITHASTKAEFLGCNVEIDATKQLYFDSGSNTYIYESVADTLSFYCGGVHMLDLVEGASYDYVEVTAPHGLLLPDIDPPLADYANRHSFLIGWAIFYTDSPSSITGNTYNVSSVTVVNYDVTLNWATNPATTSGISDWNMDQTNRNGYVQAAGYYQTLGTAAYHGKISVFGDYA